MVVAGMLLLGLPAPLYLLSSAVGPLLAVSLVRGLGFGMLTVAGSALVAELVVPGQRGRASGRYGVSVGIPQLVLLPAGVGVVDVVGFGAVFWLAAALPAVGALVAAEQDPAGRAARRGALNPAPGGPAMAAGRTERRAVLCDADLLGRPGRADHLPAGDDG
ncbi:MAG: MFS transporter [Pseudonocardiaceae bacterium]|nr:MFS transporter [Pseudonocardiaceae bacterium]